MKRKKLIIIIVAAVLIIVTGVTVPVSISLKNKSYEPNAILYQYYIALMESISMPSWIGVSLISDTQNMGQGKYTAEYAIQFQNSISSTKIKLKFDKGRAITANSDRANEELILFNKDFIYDSLNEDESITKLFADMEANSLPQSVSLFIGFKETISAEDFLLSDFRKNHQILFAPIDLRYLGNYYSSEIGNEPVLGMNLNDAHSVVPPVELDALLGINRLLLERRARVSVDAETVAIEKLLAPKYVFEEILQRIAKPDINKEMELILNYGINNQSTINLERTADFYFNYLRFTQYGNVGPQVMGCQIICDKDQITEILSDDNCFLIKHI